MNMVHALYRTHTNLQYTISKVWACTFMLRTQISHYFYFLLTFDDVIFFR